MKEGLFYSSMMAVCLSFLMLFASVSCDDDDDDYATTKTYSISGDASGSQMVPSVTGTGTGTITGTYNTRTREMNYTSNWVGLSGAPTSGGFYSGAAGSSGVAIGTPWTFAVDATGTGTTTGTMTLTKEQGDALVDGNWYYSYRTTANPNGEVRGQMTATAMSSN